MCMHALKLAARLSRCTRENDRGKADISRLIGIDSIAGARTLFKGCGKMKVCLDVS